MDRISYIDVAGTKCPLHFSVAAAEKVDEHFGGLENMGEKLSAGSMFEKLNEAIWLLSVLLEQGAAYMRLIERPEVKVWTVEQLKVLFGIGDFAGLKDQLLGAMSVGTRTTVDTEKNGETTQGQ